MLTTGQVLKILGITKITLYRWIDKGKIHLKQRHEIGKRVIFDFDPAEVNRVKKLMLKNPKPGRSLLK